MNKRERVGRRGVAWWLVRVLLPLLVLAGAFAYAYWLVLTKHKPERRPAAERAAVVEVVTLKRESHQVVVRHSGFVVAARRIALQARVGSEVIDVADAFIPGGLFSEGEMVLRLDATDFELSLAQRRSEVARAEFDYQLELGSQEIARHEWALIENNQMATDLERSLAMRVPHLAKAEAALKSAQAQLRQAELNLDRTEVRAPFNAVVLSRTANVGAQVTPQTVLADLVDTDEYWVEVTLPSDELKWIELPDSQGRGGSVVLVTPPPGVQARAEWSGRVLRQRVDLEERGRLAQVLVSVPRPLDVPAGVIREVPLLIGALARVEIFGPVLQEVFVLPQTVVHEGRWIWVMSATSRLQIRELEKVWEDREVVLVQSGLEEGEKLVTTDLGAPVEGMLLRLPRPLDGSGDGSGAGPAGAVRGGEAG